MTPPLSVGIPRLCPDSISGYQNTVWVPAFNHKSLATQLKHKDQNPIQSMVSNLINRIAVEQRKITIYLNAVGLAESLSATQSIPDESASVEYR